MVVFAGSSKVQSHTQQAAKKELLVNGAFKQGTDHWKIEEAGAKGISVVTKAGPKGIPALQLKVTKVGDKSWQLQVYHADLNIVKGKTYKLSFYVKALKPETITVNCMQTHEPWEHHGAAKEVAVTQQWKKETFTFVGPWTDDNARITFTNLGTTVGQTYWFADCSLRGDNK